MQGALGGFGGAGDLGRLLPADHHLLPEDGGEPAGLEGGAPAPAPAVGRGLGPCFWVLHAAV